MLLRGLLLIALMLAAVVCLAADAFCGWMWLWLLPLTALGFTLVLLLGAFGYLLLLCKRVDTDKEQTEDDPVYRKMAELYIESILPAVRITVKTKGMQKAPKEGRFLLVCNHTSDLDPAPLLYAFPGRQLAFIAKKEVKDMFVVGPVLHKLLGQFINRENDREALRTILKCIQILKEDKASVAVFPEGRIHDDRKFHRFRPGVFKIAQKARVPIVVCTLKNAVDMIPNLCKLKPTELELSLLEVIPPEELADVPTTEIAERVYRLMAADLGPERVAAEQNA